MPELFPYVCFTLAGIKLIAWLGNDLNGAAGEDFGEAMSTERFERGFCCDSYVDEASGLMEKNESGQMAMTSVTLKPRIGFSGEKRLTGEEVDALHHKSHEACFIANSVKTEVVVE